MRHAVEQTERGKIITYMLRVIAHTSNVDPDFLTQCIAATGDKQHTGFGAYLEQNQAEFLSLLEHIKHCRSALEIGSRYGESLKAFAHSMQPRSKLVAVDLPYAPGVGAGMPDPEPVLKQTVADLYAAGHETHLIIGDSHDPKVVAMAVAHGPFDFLFIDGDHSYEGAKADWENYGQHAKIVAFHDIINNPGCARVWREVKAEAERLGHRTIEYTQSLWLGIGIVFKNNQGV